jgi:hypothetical protein
MMVILYMKWMHIFIILPFLVIGLNEFMVLVYGKLKQILFLQSDDYDDL